MQCFSEAFDERDPNEENIFQEFVPRSKINHSPPIDEVTCCEEDDFTLQTNHRCRLSTYTGFDSMCVYIT